MVKPEFVYLAIPDLAHDLPNRVWTYDQQGDPSDVLEWNRVGGGWRTTYPDGSVSAAHSTRDLRIYRPILTADPRLAT